VQEVKNGRLAMVAFFGIVAQHAATGATPLEALKAHLASPLTANFATNGVSENLRVRHAAGDAATSPQLDHGSVRHVCMRAIPFPFLLQVSLPF
jgi:hypothetical protein